MSIIVLQHSITDNFDVDPSWDISSQGRISAGTLVGLDANGFVKKAGAADALGICGDSLSDEYQTTAYSAELVIGAGRKVGSDYLAPKRWTQNRIDNYFNETLASGKMTVYTTGGLFGTTEYVVGPTYTPGTKLYSNGSGKFTATDPGSGRVVGYTKVAAGEYPSGVPGVDAPAVQNSMSLGKYLFVQLSI